MEDNTNKYEYPKGWFSNKRITTRKKISDLAFEKSEIQDIDLATKAGREEFQSWDDNKDKR